MIKTLKKILLVFLCLISIIACGTSKEEKVKTQMETYLREKYGEEFVVDMIGLRSANEEKFYQARIYPKSIIGTPREDDDYYYGSASIDVDAYGKLSKGTGDDYSFIKRNDDVENYLLPKVKELFGDSVRLKVDVKHEVSAELDYEAPEEDLLWIGYKSTSLKEMREDIAKDPKHERMLLSLYIYIFDKIDNEKEKEERRKQLFEFLQYLRSEGVDRFLKIFMVFADNVILAPSFENDIYSLEDSDDVDKRNIEKKLRNEIEKISIDDYIKNIGKIKKSDISVSSEGRLYKYNEADFFIITMKMLKIDMFGRYDEAKKNNTLDKHYYKTKDDIEFSYWDTYIFRGDKNK